jgi:hypothetical protein
MGGPAPEWVQIFPSPTYVGELDGEKKTWITDEISQESCVDFFNLRGNDLVVDYEHLSDKDVEAPAAGRIVELRAGGASGLLARVEWTERARAQLEAGEYYYDSPSFFWSRKDDRIYGLRHLALTNNPGSWHRPYITDHARTDFGIERTSQNKGGAPLRLLCATANNKGGREKELNQLLESLRFTVGRPITVTGKELRADLVKLAELVPDTEETIFLEEGSESGGASAKRIAHLLGDEQLTAAIEATSQKAGADGARAERKDGSLAVDLTPIALALGIETTDTRELALAVMSLKASSASAERVRELEERLAVAETKSAEERIAFEIARQRKAGKQITPAFEADLIRVAKSDVALALSSLEGLQVTSIDLATQSDAPTPTADAREAARQRRDERAAALPDDASESLKASASVFAETIAIANEKGLTYPEANRLRLESLRVAA